MSDKSHAKEYLEKYIAENDVPRWLSELIEEVIKTNENPSETRKQEIYSNLLKENKLKASVNSKSEQVEEVEDETEVSDEEDRLNLDKIAHLSGVNALSEDSSLHLTPDCTIVFGLNGTGKSGYFRIINELAGADDTKEILSNIHKDEDDLNVEIDYSLDNNSQPTFSWTDKYERGIDPFDRIKVFDTEYLPFYLDERESVLNLEPLGLHLFRVITNVIDEFKEKIKFEKETLEGKRIDIQPLIEQINSEDVENILLKESLFEEDKEQLEEYYNFSDNEKSEVRKIEKEKSDLEKNNTDSQQKLLTQDIEEIKELKDHLEKLKEETEKSTTETSQAIDDYKSKRKVRDERLKEFKVLENIPSKDSNEWNEFIESAEVYGNAVTDKLDSEKECIYCHQPLTPDALELTKAYSNYLSDKSQNDLKEASNKILIETENLEKIGIKFSLSENLEKDLKQIKDEDDVGSDERLQTIFSGAENQTKRIADSLKNKTKIDKEYSLDITKILKTLSEISKEKNELLKKLGKSKEGRQKEIEKINKQLEYLKDKENLTKWRDRIEKHFLNYDQCELLDKLDSGMSTTSITVLGSKAHDELLTDSIKKSFESELEALGKDIDVTLERIRSTKGSVTTKLRILENDVIDILSEGEQKAVGIGLFLAEIESLEGSDPVVFDDPVNSLDHKVSAKLAKRLIKMSADRQVIIFTHNKHFYDSLIYWANRLKDDHDQKMHHICKNYASGGCSGRGHHVLTYKADKRSKKETGYITEYQIESSEYFIKKAEQEIAGDNSVPTISGHLKSAIEYYIDEKILLKTGLNKDRVHGQSIPWEQLKGIKSNKETLEKLQSFWEELSNRGSHRTQNSNETPMGTDEFQEIIDFLKT